MPVRIEIRLTPSERRMLRRRRRTSKSAKVRDRITGVLMLAAGLRVGDILEALSISRATLANWRKRWLTRRGFGLDDAPRPGRPPQANAQYIAAMVSAVRKDPRDLGYAFTRWTAPRLSAYLGEATGVRLTPHWVTELLRLHGFVWRKTKRTIRNLQNPRATRRAQRALRRLKKGLSIPRPIMSSGLRMASDSSSCP